MLSDKGPRDHVPPYWVPQLQVSSLQYTLRPHPWHSVHKHADLTSKYGAFRTRWTAQHTNIPNVRRV